MLWRENFFKVNDYYVAIWSVPPAAHMSCKSMYLRIRLPAAQTLLNNFKNPPFVSVQFNNELHSTKYTKQVKNEENAIFDQFGELHHADVSFILNKIVGCTECVKLLSKSSMCFGKIQHQTPHHKIH